MPKNVGNIFGPAIDVRRCIYTGGFHPFDLAVFGVSSVWLYVYLLSEFEGRPFMETYCLSQALCAATPVRRHE